MNRNPTHAFTGFGTETEKNWPSQIDLANWGIEDVAYVKPIYVDGTGAYGIFAADGTELAQMNNRDEAIVTVRQNDLEALSVH